MPDYKRLAIKGGTYFFTQVIYDRDAAWLCNDIARTALKQAITKVRKKYPFSIEAFVLLPDHFHCILTLPENDGDYATRWRLIKTFVTKQLGDRLMLKKEPSMSRKKRGERNIWQRRYWEHLIRDEQDFSDHINYLHYNPVKHELCTAPEDWRFSSFHKFVKKGIYNEKWGSSKNIKINQICRVC
ncbi:transposase [Desulfobacterales bacterium HSG17]|nr:transposase [Desulfobacterales bacterium HSG17]